VAAGRGKYVVQVRPRGGEKGREREGSNTSQPQAREDRARSRVHRAAAVCRRENWGRGAEEVLSTKTRTMVLGGRNEEGNKKNSTALLA